MRFLLLGDIHCYGHYVFDAIKQVGLLGPLDAVVGVGDLTNTGGQIEVESVAGAVKSGLEAIDCPNAPYLTPMGNHDYGNKVNSDEDNALYRARFESVVGISYRQVTKVKGYTFITFSARNHSASYTAEDYRWLDEQLSMSDDLPTFVACHYSSGALGLYGDNGQKESPLDEVLKKHPNAVLLCGHSHAYLANERSFMQSEWGYHTVNAGSLWQSAKADSIPGTVTGYYIPAVTVVECEGDEVTMRRYNTDKGAFFGRPWVITAGCDSSLEARADLVASPEFCEGELEITNIGATSALVSYPQAMGEAEYYEAQTCSATGETATAKFTSYYFMPRRGKGCMQLDGLTPDSLHTLTLYPVDFYGRYGKGLSVAFETAPLTREPANLIYDGPIIPEMWTGDSQNIREEVGFATDSDESTPYIVSKDKYDLGNSFAVFAQNHRNQYNNSDSDFSCLQVGRYTAATCRTKEGNRVAILDGWQIGAGNPFDSDCLVAEAALPYAIGRQSLGLTLGGGKLTLWRDSLPALCVDALAEEKAVNIALRLGETWGVFKNCAYFDRISIKND